MARDIAQLHPRLQDKARELINLCEKNGIKIAIGECLRTVAEQDALYAQGRTTKGSVVTNAKGTSYSSQHQWGIAFDFYIAMDIDGDGQSSDDAFNNSTGFFDKVGTLAKSIGLGWGGDWKSIKDRPHIYLPDWGSTPTKLKSIYGTPEKFFATWTKASTQTPVQQPTANKVAEWQKSAIADGFSFPKYGADGKWGSECEDVARKAICKKRANYQYHNLTKIVQTAIGVKADGLFGTNTRNAVIAYQRNNRLTVDGCVGLNTWKKILGI